MTGTDLNSNIPDQPDGSSEKQSSSQQQEQLNNQQTEQLNSHSNGAAAKQYANPMPTQGMHSKLTTQYGGMSSLWPGNNKPTSTYIVPGDVEMQDLSQSMSSMNLRLEPSNKNSFATNLLDSAKKNFEGLAGLFPKSVKKGLSYSMFDKDETIASLAKPLAAPNFPQKNNMKSELKSTDDLLPQPNDYRPKQRFILKHQSIRRLEEVIDKVNHLAELSSDIKWEFMNTF